MKSFMFGQISAIVEPIAAVIGVVLVTSTIGLIVGFVLMMVLDVALG